ncbi:group 1 truncated hemoglobin [Plantactinospora sp. GCM10030261]|uniref:group I truncated hemoglobin n=1 Tax=Plantactinospora sp. GCM10030261 TaxID=3273420 RepID=UPI00360670CB
MSDATAPIDNAAPAAAGPTHFERIGGTPAVKAAVDLFYEQVLDDPQLAPYFVDVNMPEQRRHMVLMLTLVLGGPNAYTGRPLDEAHKPLNIPGAHYELVGEYLVRTLRKLDVPADVIDDVQAILGQVRGQVVSDGDPVGA